MPLDNNETEQKMRVLVMGRHNFQGMRSERGMKAASVLYTLTQSCVKQNVDPAAYLRAAVEAAQRSPPEVLLPHQYAQELKK